MQALGTDRAALGLGEFLPILILCYGNDYQWLAIINALGVLAVLIISAKSLQVWGQVSTSTMSAVMLGIWSVYATDGFGTFGASIGSAFNLIVSLFNSVARFSIGILLLLLYLVNMFLSFLSGYVHGARLIFVEFFGKFTI